VRPARFWVDSLVHDADALLYLIRVMGPERVGLAPRNGGSHRVGLSNGSRSDLWAARLDRAESRPNPGYPADEKFFDPRVNRVDPSIVNEAGLCRRAAEGDRDARRELFERYREAAYQAAFRVTGRREDALDVLQDAFIKAFEGLAGFQREAGFKTWLLRIVTNRSLDVLRARKVRLAVPIDAAPENGRTVPLVSDDAEAPGAELERHELAERIQAAVEKLPAEQKTVFALYATGEMTYGQIAGALGIPIGTVMSRLFHARRKLHELLADLAPEGLEKVIE